MNPNSNPFLTVGSPNYATPLLNFQQLRGQQQGAQTMPQQQGGGMSGQPGQMQGAVNQPVGQPGQMQGAPNQMQPGLMQPGQPQNGQPQNPYARLGSNFAAGLRGFMQPQQGPGMGGSGMNSGSIGGANALLSGLY